MLGHVLAHSIIFCSDIINDKSTKTHILNCHINTKKSSDVRLSFNQIEHVIINYTRYGKDVYLLMLLDELMNYISVVKLQRDHALY